jgi:hypothetical protein
VLGEGTLFIAILSPRNQEHFKKQYHCSISIFKTPCLFFIFFLDNIVTTWLLHGITALDKGDPNVGPSLSRLGMGGLLWERPHPWPLSYTFSWHQGSNVRTIPNMIFR